MKLFYKFTFILILFVVLYPNISFAEKYSMRERFGVGGVPGYVASDPNPMNLGWYFNWTYYGSSLTSYYDLSVDFMPTLGGFGKDNYPGGPNQPTCASWIETMKASPKIYRNGTMVTIGNEIGFDDGRTPTDYANAFKKWYDCIKSYNPKIKVGTGANPWTATSQPANITGKEFFKQVISQLGSTYSPDFIVHHGYSYRSGTAAYDADGTVWIINDIRKDMNSYGLRNKDLIIKEFSPSTASDFNKSVSYMDTVVNFFASAKDSSIGNPDDGNRLVQKWAWFVSSESPTTLNNNPSWWYYVLFDPYSLALSTAGIKYKSLVDKYVPSNATCVVQGYKLAYGPNTSPNPIESSNISVSGNGVNTSCATNPCVFSNLPGNKTYTVTLNQPAGFRVFSTSCFNFTDCHDRYSFSRATSNTRIVYCPAGGYVDLWWGAESGMDLDNNNLINSVDINSWIGIFFNSGFSALEFDYNKDGAKDLRDLITILKVVFN